MIHDTSRKENSIHSLCGSNYAPIDLEFHVGGI